jgi:hypothetical protein
MSFIGKIAEFDSAAEDLEMYLERLELFFEANDVKIEKKPIILLQLIGPSAYKTLKSLFSPELPKSKTYVQLTSKLKEHYQPVKSVIVACFTFNKRSQKEGESINDYSVALQHLASACQFEAHLDRALRDRFVCGVLGEEIRQVLLNSTEEISFAKACQLARGLEAARCNAQAVGVEPTINKVENFKKQQGNFKIQQEKCRHCGRRHSEDLCPARNWTCFNCNRLGHTSRVCRSKSTPVQQRAWRSSESRLPGKRLERVNQVSGTQPEEEYYCGEEFIVRSIQVVKMVSRGPGGPVKVQMLVENINLEMEVDSGAVCSIISDKLYRKKFKHVPLCPTSLQLRTPLGERFQVLGEMMVSVRHHKGSSTLPLVVVGSSPSLTPLLGRTWLDILQPGWRTELLGVGEVKTLGTIDPVKPSFLGGELVARFPTVFRKDGPPILGYVADIVLTEEACPVFHKAYKVPYAITEAVQSELRRLVDTGTLVPVKSGDWASPLVVVQKKDGAVRLCVDFKVTLNKVVQVDYYTLPVIEDIFASVAGGAIFSVLDLSNAYLQLPVSEKSRKLLTVNTGTGLFQFTRLPYGLKSSPTIFQAVMDQVLRNIPGVCVYLDDILVASKTLEEHKRTLVLVLERLASCQIRVNASKCIFAVESVEYLGHRIDSKGIYPTTLKLEAITQAPEPENLKQLQAYLGLLNFYNKFLPMLSTVLRPLHKLTEKGMSWEWSESCRTAFQQSKELLCSNQLLVHYNPSLPIVVACDASPYGVGAVLSHVIAGEERPVVFTSTTLNAAERGYAQVEREALAVVFAVKRLHKYLYGRKFTLVTDHQCLQYIFGPKKGIPAMAAAKLQRWAIVLSAYSYDIVYKTGKLLAHADALSRLPLSEVESAELSSDVSPALILQVKVLDQAEDNQVPITARDVAKATGLDPILSQVLGYVQHGWPSHVDNENLKPYLSRRRELSIDKQCITWGNRVVIPQILREHVLSLVHELHPGVVRSKLLCRSFFWWPGLDQDIERQVACCDVCQRNQRRSTKSDVSPWPAPYRCWQRVHLDFAEVDGIKFLVLKDSHSKWISVWKMGVTAADKVIDHLRAEFAVFGLPDTLVTDNGPPFQSAEFSAFCVRNGISLMHSPPYHPASNGLAEQAVGLFKKSFVKLGSSERGLSVQEKIDVFLFKYRNTPSTVTGFCPSEIMLKQRPKTKLDLLKPSACAGGSNVAPREPVKARMQFEENQEVWVVGVNKQGDPWLEGVIRTKVSSVTYLVEVAGRVRLVHVDHLRNRATSTKEIVVTPSVSTDEPGYNRSPRKSLLVDPGSPGGKLRMEDMGARPIPPAEIEPRRSGRAPKPVVRLDL